ncbi:MAG: hypothetical protein IKU90_07520 [Clostridia bacterium]|nr:hypothetical protein [Clostridia bacterium]
MKNNRLRLLILLALVTCMLGILVACVQSDPVAETTDEVTAAPTEATTEPESEETPTAEATTAEVTTEEATTEEVTTEEVTTEEVTTLRELEWESYDPALDNSVVDQSAAHKVDSSQWIAQDGLDRVLATNTQTGDVREDKIVAMFYWTWHGNFADEQTAFNNQQNIDKLIELGYTERDYMTMSISQLRKLGIKTQMGPYHFWDEPIYGYYDGDDEWVIRKQAELLAAAGVDVVFFDNTNGTYTWKETAIKVMKVFSEARAQGVDAPDVSFMFPFGAVDWAGTQMVELYRDIYSQGLYEEVWFKLDGKPMVMGWPGSLNSKDEALAKEIKNFFTFRSNLGGYLDKETTANQWGWLSRFPQAYFHNDKGEIEQITVGTAVNHNYVKSIIAPMSYGENIIGRTWTSRGYDTRENALLYGACFAEQWENAIAVDPKIVFVTAWNEWVAMRIDNWPASPEQYQNCFVDQYNAEYSRDCEPSAGILKDHYYYQLVDYIRQFKGTNPIEKASWEKLIDVNGGYGQWADLTPVYNDYFGLPDRDFDGYKDPYTGKRLHYTNDSGRNDIYDAKVARDYENVYFMVRTVEELTPYTDAYWMRLYIDMGESDKNWENYEFILNKQNPKNETTATLERFTGDGFATEVVGEVTYSVKGNVLTVCIPKTMLGIPAEELDFSFGFKWTDNTLEDGDIMQWYLNGDVAPVGRFNYCYTTTGSAEFTPENANLGNSYLDFTNTDKAQEIQTWMTGNVHNMDATYGADGLTLTATGSDSEFVLDFTKASPQVVLDRYDTILITYKIESDSSNKIRISLGAGNQATAQSGRAKSVTLVADGEVHTVAIELKTLRTLEGYLYEFGLYHDKTAAVGSAITIQSIQFVNAAETAE